MKATLCSISIGIPICLYAIKIHWCVRRCQCRMCWLLINFIRFFPFFSLFALWAFSKRVSRAWFFLPHFELPLPLFLWISSRESLVLFPSICVCLHHLVHRFAFAIALMYSLFLSWLSLVLPFSHFSPATIPSRSPMSIKSCSIFFNLHIKYLFISPASASAWAWEHKPRSLYHPYWIVFSLRGSFPPKRKTENSVIEEPLWVFDVRAWSLYRLGAFPCYFFSLLLIYFRVWENVCSFVPIQSDLTKSIIEVAQKTVFVVMQLSLVWIIKWEFALNNIQNRNIIIKANSAVRSIFFFCISVCCSCAFSNRSFQLRLWELIICDLIVCVRECICADWYRDTWNISTKHDDTKIWIIFVIVIVYWGAEKCDLSSVGSGFSVKLPLQERVSVFFFIIFCYFVILLFLLPFLVRFPLGLLLPFDIVVGFDVFVDFTVTVCRCRCRSQCCLIAFHPRVPRQKQPLCACACMWVTILFR